MSSCLRLPEVEILLVWHVFDKLSMTRYDLPAQAVSDAINSLTHGRPSEGSTALGADIEASRFGRRGDIDATYRKGAFAAGSSS